MQKAISIWLLTISMTFVYSLKPLHAQEETKAATEDDGAKSNNPAKPVHAYRVDFSITELADGKKVNARHYSMVANSGPPPWSSLKIGTKIPVATESYSNASTSLINKQFQYLDVGTNIDCEVREQGEDLLLDVRSDFSNLSSDDDQRTHQPIIRQIKINGRTITPPGKAVVIGAVDDPTSNRQYQLEAVVTKLK
jgi:hypothetical protein